MSTRWEQAPLPGLRALPRTVASSCYNADKFIYRDLAAGARADEVPLRGNAIREIKAPADRAADKFGRQDLGGLRVPMRT